MPLLGCSGEVGELTLDYLEGAPGAGAPELGHATFTLRLIRGLVRPIFLPLSLFVAMVLTSLLVIFPFYIVKRLGIYVFFNDGGKPLILRASVFHHLGQQRPAEGGFLLIVAVGALQGPPHTLPLGAAPVGVTLLPIVPPCHRAREDRDQDRKPAQHHIRPEFDCRTHLRHSPQVPTGRR